LATFSKYKEKVICGECGRHQGTLRNWGAG
jgi:ribosomal protein S14